MSVFIRTHADDYTALQDTEIQRCLKREGQTTPVEMSVLEVKVSLFSHDSVFDQSEKHQTSSKIRLREEDIERYLPPACLWGKETKE